MSSKSVIQLIILIIIFIILGSVYLKFFSKQKITVDQTPQMTEKKINTNSRDDDKKEDKSEVVNATIKDNSKEEKNFETNKTDLEKSDKKKDNEIPNIVKDVEYLTSDKNGNKYKILATSGRTNQNDQNILDLNNVRGEVTSNQRSTIYIVSDFAEYNASNLNSKFYKNVVCLLYTSPSPRDAIPSRMPSSA